jgi:RNA recognition motif-containing protein
VTTIYVGNLSFRATEEDVRQAFLAYGEVSGVDLAIDRETGNSRGFAFVEMPDPDQARAAIEALDSSEIIGSEVLVSEAPPRASAGQQPQV